MFEECLQISVAVNLGQTFGGLPYAPTAADPKENMASLALQEGNTSTQLLVRMTTLQPEDLPFQELLQYVRINVAYNSFNLTIIGTASLRGRKQLSEPPSDILCDISLPSLPPAGPDCKQVGVVKPYAVVDLHETWKQLHQAQECLQRPRVGSCGTVMLYDATKRRIEAPRALQKRERKSIVPKRKAPPPPVTRTQVAVKSITANSKRVTISRASSVPTLLITDAEEEESLSPIDNTNHIEEVPTNKDKSPPCKPPRTQSTYISYDEVPHEERTACSDYEPLHRSSCLISQQRSPTPTISPDLAASSLSLLQQFQDLFDETLGDIAQRHLEELTSTDQHLQNMDWSDITASVDLKNQHQLYYHMQPISLEVSDALHKTILLIMTF